MLRYYYDSSAHERQWAQHTQGREIMKTMAKENIIKWSKTTKIILSLRIVYIRVEKVDRDLNYLKIRCPDFYYQKQEEKIKE